MPHGANEAVIRELRMKGEEKMSDVEVKRRMTVTEVAEIIGISAKTIMRWEKMGKIRKPKRDWRGWRVYDERDVEQIRNFHEAVFEVE